MSEQPTIMPRYAVHPIEGKIEREIITFKSEKGKDGKTRQKMHREVVEEPGGWIVYTARGDSFRVRSLAELKRLELDEPPEIVDMESGTILGREKVFDLRAMSQSRTKVTAVPTSAATHG